MSLLWATRNTSPLCFGPTNSAFTSANWTYANTPSIDQFFVCLFVCLFACLFVFTKFPEERATRPSGSGCLAAKFSGFLQNKVFSAGPFRPFRGGQSLCGIAEEGRYSGHRGEATKRCAAQKLARKQGKTWKKFVAVGHERH